MNQNSTKNLLIIALAFALVWTLFKGCGFQKQYESSLNQILSLQDSVTVLRKSVDEKGRQLASTEEVVVQKSKEIEEQLKEIKALKSLERKIVFTSETVYDSIQVPIHDTTIVTKTDTVKVKTFEFNDNWITMKGFIYEKHMEFDTLKIINKYNIEIGKEKQGFFKRSKQVIYIRSDNPHSDTKQVVSYVLEQKKKWYQSGAVKVFIGAAATFLILKS